jgi:WD40 repeat protein
VEGCLESEPAQRTATTTDILEDFRRRRRHQPLVCRQPWSLGYRSVRFLRRNLVAVSLACALLVGLGWSFATVVSSRNQAVAANNRSQDLLARLEYDQGLALADSSQSQTAALWYARAAGRQPGDPRYLLILKNWPVRLIEFRDLGEMMDSDVEQHGRFQVVWRRNLDLSVLEAGNRPLGPPIKYAIDAGPVLALSPDGSRLAAGRRGSLAGAAEFSLFDVASGRDVVRGQKMLRGVEWLAFSSDSRRLLRVADEELDLLDAGSARSLLSRKTTSPVAAVSSDGSLVAFSNGPRVVLAGPGKSDLELDLRDPVTLCFAGADKVLVSVSRQGAVEFFDSATGRAATTLLESGHAAVTARLSPDGRFMGVVGESQVTFFDLQGGARLGTFPCTISPSAPRIGCSFSPDSSLVAVVHPRPPGSAEIQSSVQIYRLSATTVERLGEPISLFEPLDDLGFSETNESLLVSIGDGIKTYDISRLLRNRPVLSLNGIQTSSNYPRLIDNRLAITQEQGHVTVTELATNRVLTRWKTESSLRLCLVSPDAQTLLPLYADSTVVQPVSASTGKPVGRPVTVPQVITGVAFAADGQSYATCSQDGSVTLWSLAGERLGEPLQHPYPIEEVNFDPTGRYLYAVGSGFNGLKLWDLASRKELLSSTATLAAFSDAHPWLATGTTRLDRQGARPTIKTLRLPDLSPVGAPIISQVPQNVLYFRPQSSDLLVSHFGVGVRLWSPLEARPVGRTLGLEWLYWSAFDAQGAWLATATLDSRTARLWDLVSGRPLTRPDQFLAASETGTHYRVPAFTPERDRLLVRVASSGRSPARLDVWDLTVDGDLPAEVLRLQAESWTGLRLDEQGGLELLNEAQWRQTTEHLQALLREHQAVCRHPRAAERP